MPRMISFSMTTPQFIAGTKDVTRRLGWVNVKAGDELMAVEKAMGLGKGGKVKRLGLIRVKDVRRERLNMMCEDLEYGGAECIREGFPPPGEYSDPTQFVLWFAEGHRCLPSAIVTRIEFEKLA